MSYVNQTLSNVPLGQILGAGMGAAVQAQALASQTTIDFIKDIGLSATTTGTGANATTTYEANTISFTYEVETAGSGSSSGGTGSTTSTESRSITCALLNILPIPFLRIDTFDLDFTANIQEMSSYSTERSTVFDGDISGGLGLKFLKKKLNLKGGLAYDRKNSVNQQSRNSTEYTMDLKLHAVQDEMPGGMRKILSIMESMITN